MTTVTTVDLDNSEYQQVTTAPQDAIIQNTGTADVLLIFQTSIPDPDAGNYHVLSAKGNSALQVISGVPSENAWVKVFGLPATGPLLIGQVAVST